MPMSLSDCMITSSEPRMNVCGCKACVSRSRAHALGWSLCVVLTLPSHQRLCRRDRSSRVAKSLELKHFTPTLNSSRCHDTLLSCSTTEGRGTRLAFMDVSEVFELMSVQSSVENNCTRMGAIGRRCLAPISDGQALVRSAAHWHPRQELVAHLADTMNIRAHCRSIYARC